MSGCVHVGFGLCFICYSIRSSEIIAEERVKAYEIQAIRNNTHTPYLTLY